MSFKKFIVILLVGLLVSVQAFTQTQLVPIPKDQLKEHKLIRLNDHVNDYINGVKEFKQFFPKDVKCEFDWYIVSSDDLISGKLLELEGVVINIIAWDIYWTEISDAPARIHGRKFAVIVGNVYDPKYSKIRDCIKDVFFKKSFYEMIESKEDYDLTHESVMNYSFPY